MKLYSFEAAQRLPIDLETAWGFFSNPRNLPKITPDWLGIRMTSEPPPEMYAGMIISYTVRPMFGITLRWVTEITHVDAPNYFVDEQRFGPYRFWHHQHHFRPVEGGVDIVDIVNYGLPLGPLGSLANTLDVKRRLKQIFAHRKQVLEDEFGPLQPSHV